jgi:hypothetical protein
MKEVVQRKNETKNSDNISTFSKHSREPASGPSRSAPKVIAGMFN